MPKKSTEKTKPEAARTEEPPTQQPAANLGGTPGVALPKYNPYHRPAASSAGELDLTPIRQGYEDVQREAKGPGSEEWRAADKARDELTGLYSSLREDPRYTTEHKAERAWEKYEETKARVEKLAPEAREKMLRSAESLERLSIPTPEGEGLITKDTDKLLLAAHERSRLEGLISRAEKAAEKGPWKANPTDLLKSAYEEGLDLGGPGGGATVRAVIQLARDWGLDVEKIVDSRRKPRHRENLAAAEERHMQAQLVGRSVPQPPFPHPSRMNQKPGQVGLYGSGAKGVSTPQKKGNFLPKGRRPYWR